MNKTITILILENNEIWIEDLKIFYSEITKSCGYDCEIIFIEQAQGHIIETKKEDSVFYRCKIDIFVCELSLESPGDPNAGLSIIKKVKEEFPEILVIANTVFSLNIDEITQFYPSFDLFVDKEKLVIEKYKDNAAIQLNKLLSKLKVNEQMTTFFEFPNEIRTVCEQYLLYFAQFLMDIGIEAETEIKEEAHRTLFRVIPKDRNDSLENIKEALFIYLNAPEFDNLNTKTVINNDIAFMQWQANILHLKSQLKLADSILQLKEATIHSLQLSNFQLQQFLPEKNQPKKSDKEEEIIKGIVSLKKYDGKWISINFAEILRKLKRKFK